MCRALLVLGIVAVLLPDAHVANASATAVATDEEALSAGIDRASFVWLVGVWQRRDAQLVVPDTEFARFRWRTDWCSMADHPPCDHFEGGTLVIGASADLRLGAPHAAGPNTIDAEVEAVNADGLLELGPLLLSRLDDDLIELRQGVRTIQLCRAPRELDFCDERWW